MGKNEEIRCIVPEMELVNFNNLISLELSNWKKMVCLIDTTVENVPTMAFGNLKWLTLLEMNSLKELCGGRMCNKFLQKLERVTIKECPKLCSIFKVQEEEIGNEDNLMLFSSLQWLFPEDLPELSCVWEGPTRHINLNRLTRVTIERCSKLKSIFSLSTMARTLVHLQDLDIRDCDELEHIIFEEEENGLQPSTIIRNIIFTRLESVVIENCKKLKYVFPIFLAPSFLQQLQNFNKNGNGALEQIFKYAEANHMEIELSHLEYIFIKGSPKLVNLCGRHCSSLSFPSLRGLKLVDCAIQFPRRLLSLSGKQLVEAWLHKVPKEWGNYILSQLIIKDLPNLNSVAIGSLIGVPKEWGNYIVSQLTIGDLPNLNSLLIASLMGVEEVIRLEVDNQRSDLVLSIRTLELHDLPELVHICNCPSYTTILQNLTHLHIISCHKLRYIFSPTLAQNLPMLEELVVADCKELVHVIGNADQGVPNSLKLEGFPSLEEIRIKKCNKIKFVFPLSFVVGGLPNLEKLRIQECDGVEYVFGNETLEARKNSIGKEEVVLPKLENIVLNELPSLIRIFVAGYNFIISGTGFQMTDCPNFTGSFTLSATHGTTIAKENASLNDDSKQEIV